MSRKPCPLARSLLLACLAAPLAALAQTYPVNDPVLRAIWAEGTKNSQLYPLAQALFDSIGPRLTGTAGNRGANDWALAKYRAWGITARNEQFGTWRGWRRGHTFVELVAPRERTLDATMLAWSPGTKGAVEGEVVILPDVAGAAEFEQWAPQSKGRFVLVSQPQASCRPLERTKEYATPESFERWSKERTADSLAWAARLRKTGLNADALSRRLDAAGAAGVLSSNWTGQYGTTVVSATRNATAPAISVNCEDYGLLFRLALNHQGPRLRVDAESESLGEVPVFNTIAELRGTERPDEYVMLSAHFDSWDSGTGATDDGTATVAMMEAMRILKTAYPRPKRTILVGHWTGEELGSTGSRSFAADHPEVVKGLQALFNQDNGTGRINDASAGGLVDAGAFLARWIARLPSELTSEIVLQLPGSPLKGSSDHRSFLCYGAPGFRLGSHDWDYRDVTHHTNRDTFDKIFFDDLRHNALLFASLAYVASEEPNPTPRTKREMGAGVPTGSSGGNAVTGPGAEWPACTTPPRSFTQGR
jgi:hypothetical protein